MRPLSFARNFTWAAALSLLSAAPAVAADIELKETHVLEHKVEAATLPPIAERVPAEPLVVDLAARGRTIGRHGGELRSLIGRAKDVRYMVVYGYARLVGYDEDFVLRPDILKEVKVEEGRIFTFSLRKGHKWSDGAPFTSEDFRYWWEDVANNKDLAPGGPPELMLVEGQPPVFEVLSETEVRYTWPIPNPRFLPALAAARPPFIYRPSAFLKKYHGNFADPAELAEIVEKKKKANWAQVHNKLDNMYKFDNPKLPTLQPWLNTTKKNNTRYILERNPFYHRIDATGQQLPYIDKVELTVAAGGLIPAKTNRGEVDIQARGISFSDAPVLKDGEAEGGYRTLLWFNGYGSDMALYPNQTVTDPQWRSFMRNADFRRALSVAISRRAINKVLYFGMAKPAATAALPASPFYTKKAAQAWAQYDPELANEMLDKIGLDKRDSDGWRLLPDGQRAEIIIESAGERPEETAALELIQIMWGDVGIKLSFRSLDRDILRSKAYSGVAMMPIWQGWNNGIPTPGASPKALAPVDQANFSWPKWGQYFQTKGSAGEEADTPEARRLMELFQKWSQSANESEQSAIWEEMLEIHADQVYAIGLISGAPQPIVVNAKLRNVTEEGVYAWEPAAQLGAYRIDELYYAE
ncbi:MAG: ABC transporter substrate-binding protein [Pikeienuella sp.]